jgi:hypothetical protein
MAQAYSAVAVGSSFLIGGTADGKPAIWISGPELSGIGGGAATASAIPAQPINLTGAWEATDLPPDSSHLTMELVALPDGNYDVTIRDDFASVCDGATSTMTGVAEPRDANTIDIEHPDYACDDGSEARALSGPPLDQQLRYLSLTYDALRDALFDQAGLEWTRAAP